MPIVSRRLFKNNIVKNPPSLPVPIKLGSLTVTKSFQDHPSASITYEGILEEDISSYEQVYEPSRSTRISIDGIPFRVAPDGGYSYERTGYLYKGTKKINVYTVSINLEGWWKVYCSRSVKIKPLVNMATGTLSASRLASKVGVNLSGGFDIFLDEVGEDSVMSLDDVLEEYALVKGCYVHYGQFVALKDINSGSSYSFSWEEQLSDGSNQLGVAPYYNGAALTWTPRESNKEQVDPNAPPEFKEKEPELKTEYEYDQDVTNPPRGTAILRSLDSNLDQSGPKKVRRTTYSIDGQTDREVIETWGFAYYLKDFVETPDGLIIYNPANFWKLIEYQETRYYYQEVVSPIYTLAKPQNTQEIKYELVVHPDYEDYVESVGFDGIKFKASKAKYLTSIVTSGWKLSRFQQEEIGGDTDTREMIFVGGEGMIEEMIPGWVYVGPPGQERRQWGLVKTGRLLPDPWWKVVKFQKINRQDVTNFYIKSMRSDYEQDAVPYSIEWVFWDEMDEQMQRMMFSKVTPPREGSNQRLKVGLITADMDFVEPMLVWTESRQASSIATMAHPDSTEEDPLPALVTGEESYYQSIWTKKNDEYSTEKIVELTASGAGFVDGVENIRYREIQGRPPEAQYRKTTWEQQQPKATITLSASRVITSRVTKRYFVYSDSIPEWASEGGESLSFGAASTLSQAEKAAKTQLTINTLQSTQETRTVSWHFPNIEGGDFCTFSGDRFRGRFRVLSASYTLEYDGSQNAYGLDPICKTDGTKLTLGLWDSRSIRVETREDPIPSNEGSDNNQGEDPKVDNNATIITLGGVLPSTVPGRRN